MLGIFPSYIKKKNYESIRVIEGSREESLKPTSKQYYASRYVKEYKWCSLRLT